MGEQMDHYSTLLSTVTLKLGVISDVFRRISVEVKPDPR